MDAGKIAAQHVQEFPDHGRVSCTAVKALVGEKAYSVPPTAIMKGVHACRAKLPYGLRYKEDYVRCYMHCRCAAKWIGIPARGAADHDQGSSGT